MQVPSYERVVDHLVSALAESRRKGTRHHAAYLALARAILDEDCSQGADAFSAGALEDH